MEYASSEKQVGSRSNSVGSVEDRLDDMYDEEDNPSFFSMKGKTAQKAIVTPLSGNFLISVRINHGSRLSQTRGGFYSCLLIPAHDCNYAISRPNIPAQPSTPRSLWS